MATVVDTQQLSPTSPTAPEATSFQKQQPQSSASVEKSASSKTIKLPNGKLLGEPVIRIQSLSKSYKLIGTEDQQVTALNDVTLQFDQLEDHYSIRRGEFVILRGPSGGGKSTLLNCIGSIDAPSTGTIHINDVLISGETSDKQLSQMRLEKIGFVFQTFNLLGTLSAYENVELPMTILNKLNKQQRKERTTRLLEMVGLVDRMTHLPSELSGGECQRVAIARSLSNDPEILLADEPTGDLDSRNTIEIMNLLHSISSPKDGFGTTIVMVTHNPDCEVYADRILYLQDGRITRQVLNDFKMSPIDPELFEQWVKKRDAATEE